MMTKPKRARGKGGKFLPRGQTPRTEQRPDAPDVGDHGQMPRRRCEECREELAERRVIIHGHVLYVQHCPRCTPDALVTMRE